ncbi:retrovirus-related pol polyprotein from transposon TNT 1-94 [Tanacetum coccineum]|uniref:Retrovirus-related pol polyprotein from transposon TNT 1-94 n=1 Tax=Tanacetum coccineum TaxID=301880 RepID=A0ABQ4XKJ0_9ASTR
MEDGIFFNQSKYIKEMLKKFGLEDSKPTKTPMSTEIKLTKDDEADSVDSSKYRGMIGSLLYLTASRPDIMFSVCLCARFQENPKTTHLEAVKRIFRYIRGTSHLGLWYPKGTRIETIVYADSDHAGDYVDRKSTSGICTFMGCCLTSWFAKKQTTLAISTTEAEYVSAEKACQQALWMKQALIDYGIRLDDVPIIEIFDDYRCALLDHHDHDRSQCLKGINALVDQGSDVSVMPLSTYMKLIDERPAETNIKLSLSSHSYIYPLGIADDVLVEVVEHVYPIDFVILDIKENKKRHFILGTPFLTTAKAVIKFDKGTITLRSRKNKISFNRIPESLCKDEKGIKNDIKPIALTMTVNRLVL